MASVEEKKQVGHRKLKHGFSKRADADSGDENHVFLSLKRDLNNEKDTLERMQEVITMAAARLVISHAGKSIEDYAKPIFNLSVRTLKARKPDYKLDTLQSSIIIEMFKVINHAYEVFEDRDKAQAWLSRPNKALFGHIPADYNIILDPAFKHFSELKKTVSWEMIDLDKRLLLYALLN